MVKSMIRSDDSKSELRHGEKPTTSDKQINSDGNKDRSAQRAGAENGGGRQSLTVLLRNSVIISPMSQSEGETVENATTSGMQRDKARNKPAANDDDGTTHGGSDDDENVEQIIVPLRKSNRLKGYITLLVSSIINFNATMQANNYTFVTGANPPEPKESQQRFALSVAVINMIITVPIILAHLDQISPLRKIWHKIFRPNSYIEFGILAFLAIWWSIAVWFNTTITGIAGEGTRRHNLYFSTWICCGAAYWTIERWRTASGQIATSAFLQEMPARSPAWAAVFVTNVLALTFVTNSKQHYMDVQTPLVMAIYDQRDNSPSEYQWKITQTVTCFAFLSAFIFITLELFRSKKKKGDAENVAEGIILLILSLLWIPCVAIITCPGGIAQLVGNMYLWSWASTVAVIRTFFWWVTDWREAIHDMIEVQLVEYEKAKRKALKESKEMAKEAAESRETTTAKSDQTRASSTGSDQSVVFDGEIYP
jgi:hypothetical protein